MEERKDNAKQLSDLLPAIELLKESPLDEGGAAGAYILKFVRANDLHNKLNNCNKTQKYLSYIIRIIIKI